MADDSSASVALGDVVIVGGGCYGSFYAGQLLRARERGTAAWRRLLVVDRNPDCRFAGELASAEGAELVAVCAKLEAELLELEEKDRTEMLENLGLTEPALGVVARAAFRLLGLHSFFTAGPKEIRAWTIPIGATAPQAAGAIHSDFERGFIRVEVYSVDELDQYKTEKAIREAGKLRLEGKTYVMHDSDVCHFLFNV